MESHHSYLPDEADGPGRQSDRGNPGPDRDRPAGEVGYASVPVEPPGGAGYGAPAAYVSSEQAYPPREQAYPPREQSYPPREQSYPPREHPYLPPEQSYTPPEQSYTPPEQSYTPPEQRNAFDPGYRDHARPAEQQIGYPPAVAPQSPPVPPGFTPGFPPEPRYGPSAPGTATAPTSGLPHVAADGATAISGASGDGAAAGRPPSAGEGVAAGRAPSAGDARSSASGGGWNAGVPDEETQVVRHAAEPLDRSALRRPPGGPGRVGDGVYRSRRPGTAVAITVVTVVFELMALRLLAAAFLASTVQVGGSIASAFLVIGLPMFGLGLYGLLSGAAAAPGAGARAWLRAPLVYLPVGLVLFLCAGLAAG